MSDLYSLLDALDQASSEKIDAVLATVVKVEGSAYRRPGARMLIPLYGQTVGAISGGCLEQELARKACGCPCPTGLWFVVTVRRPRQMKRRVFDQFA